ncbi:uncharacterized protein LOC120104058 [Phoenix dactylifera]|uniref:Uncharacterized protein LOC120104058 n=1 Tax=Phoenix dactylifera TaxID=42345 RepID=A0A8B8ZAN0_PHODC|nr:uncharacterized protein LOC120104058 [Phoenix dactylifera]
MGCRDHPLERKGPPARRSSDRGPIELAVGAEGSSLVPIGVGEVTHDRGHRCSHGSGRARCDQRSGGRASGRRRLRLSMPGKKKSGTYLALGQLYDVPSGGSDPYSSVPCSRREKGVRGSER